jgi:hypothetical protein
MPRPPEPMLPRLSRELPSGTMRLRSSGTASARSSRPSSSSASAAGADGTSQSFCPSWRTCQRDGELIASGGRKAGFPASLPADAPRGAWDRYQTSAADEVGWEELTRLRANVALVANCGRAGDSEHGRRLGEALPGKPEPQRFLLARRQGARELLEDLGRAHFERRKTSCSGCVWAMCPPTPLTPTAGRPRKARGSPPAAAGNLISRPASTASRTALRRTRACSRSSFARSWNAARAGLHRARAVEAPPRRL